MNSVIYNETGLTSIPLCLGTQRADTGVRDGRGGVSPLGNVPAFTRCFTPPPTPEAGTVQDKKGTEAGVCISAHLNLSLCGVPTPEHLSQ